MPHATRPRRPLPAVLVAALLGAVLAGCGSDRSGGPKGEASDIVAAAPDRTLAATSARFEVGAPRVKLEGSVDLRTGISTPTPCLLRDLCSPASPNPELKGEGREVAGAAAADPMVAIALLRGVVKVVSYGGQAIRGVSTFRYELDIAPDKAAREAPESQRAALEALAAAASGPTLYADMWVDSDGRVRRVQIPLDPSTARPMGDSKRIPSYLTVDLFDFELEAEGR